jgi:hypothetical protein
MASDRFKDNLIFGQSAFDGVSTLAPGAGPPEKILTYLAGLSTFTETRRDGALGTTAVKWLTERNFNCSGESQTVINSKASMNARTWVDGDGNLREFDLHLKPRDGTSPDQCVRIYFDYDEIKGKTIVGWVGRHPET